MNVNDQWPLGPDVWRPHSQKPNCMEIQSPNTDCMKTQSQKNCPRTVSQSQTIRKALGRKNTTKLWHGLEEHCSFEDLAAKTVEGTLRPDTNLPLELLGSERAKKEQISGFPNFIMLSTCAVKMVADPNPLSRVLHNRSQRAIPVCERKDLNKAGQAVSPSKSRLSCKEGKKCSLRVETHCWSEFPAKRWCHLHSG